MRPLALLMFLTISALKFLVFIIVRIGRYVSRSFSALILILLLCGESGSETCYAGKENAVTRSEESKIHNVTPVASLRSINRLQLYPKQITRRIKDIDCWQFNTKVGKVILTDYKWETHIQVRHPFVTTEAIRKALEHPRVVYKSNKRWIFEKDNLRVVVGNEKVVTAYYMDGR